MAMATAIAALADDVEAAYVDAIGGIAFTPDDPDFDLQYAMNNTGQVAGGAIDADVDAVEAWSLHTGDVGTVTIAIVDSGVSPHLEFSSRMVPGHNTNDPNNPDLTIDGCPHGTHVAGIAAASGNNGVGVAGVSWGAAIMPVRVLDGCSGFVSDLGAGITWAADHGANVINISLQFYNLTYSQATSLQTAIDYAHGVGAVVVASAGNQAAGGSGVVAFPARLSNIIAVSATNENDTLAPFSNFGPEIDLCAPGNNIWSTWIGDGYQFDSGTSMAAPLVSGAAALLMSYRPAISNFVTIDMLLNSVDDLGPPGSDNLYGQGRLNVFRALDQVDCHAGMSGIQAVQAEGSPVTKNRTISLVATNPGVRTAIRVKLVSLHHPDPPYSGGAATDYSALEGGIRWMGPPMQYIESQSNQTPFYVSTLQCTPYYTDWGALGPIHLMGAEIVPSSVYELQAVPEACSVEWESFYSEAKRFATGRWGDIVLPFVPPAASQQPDLADVSSMVNKFRSAVGAPIKARALLSGSVPDPSVDIGFDHIGACVDAFKGAPFPYPPPAPCP